MDDRRLTAEWFDRHKRAVLDARASWKTSPAHRKAARENSERVFILGFGVASLVDSLE